MATSSIHIGTSSSGALIHNERIFSPDYLITNDKSVNDKKHYDNVHISELEKLAKIDYQTHSINNRKLPKTATLIKEAVINLEAHHNLNDLEKVKDTLEKEYGYKITDISIHRDEGYIFTETKNYIMGRNQYKNLDETPHIAELDKDNKFYEWTLKNNNWIKGDEIKDYKINHNYHAHIVMLNYDFTKHRTIRNNLKDLSKMQTLVAKDLKMERGKCSSYVEAKNIGVEVQESRKRLNIKEYKVQKRKENELLKEVKELKQEIYNFKEMQKTITSLELTADEKKELHSLNSKVKNQAATIEDLNKKIDSLTVKNKDLTSLTSTLASESVENFKEAEKQKEKVKALETQNKSLQEEIKQKPIQTIQNNQIEVLNYLKVESELSQDFYSRIEKREFKTGLMSKEDFTIIKKQEVGTPTILEVIKSHFKKMYNSLNEKIRLLTSENANLKKANLDLRVENLKLTNENNKYKTLSITGEKKENYLDKVKRINENEKIFKEQMKKEKDQEQEKPKENINTKTQNYGYELR
jgi:hypothetical protein